MELKTVRINPLQLSKIKLRISKKLLPDIKAGEQYNLQHYN